MSRKPIGPAKCRAWAINLVMLILVIFAILFSLAAWRFWPTLFVGIAFGVVMSIATPVIRRMWNGPPEPAR